MIDSKAWYNGESSLYERCQAVIRRYEKTLDLIGEGRHRMTFDIGMNRVLKLPTDGTGIDANKHEANWNDCHHNSNWKVPLASCFLVASFDPEVPLVVMQKVDRIYDISEGWLIPNVTWRDLPKWADHCDSSQVGYDENHNIVVYDGGDCPC